MWGKGVRWVWDWDGLLHTQATRHHFALPVDHEQLETCSVSISQGLCPFFSFPKADFGVFSKVSAVFFVFGRTRVGAWPFEAAFSI